MKEFACGYFTTFLSDDDMVAKNVSTLVSTVSLTVLGGVGIMGWLVVENIIAYTLI